MEADESNTTAIRWTLPDFWKRGSARNHASNSTANSCIHSGMDGMIRSNRRPLAASRWVRSSRNSVETGISVAFRWRKWIASTAGMPSNARRPSGFARVSNGENYLTADGRGWKAETENAFIPVCLTF